MSHADFLVGTWTFTDPDVPLDTGLYALRLSAGAGEVQLISPAAAAVYYGSPEPGGEGVLLLHNDVERSAMSRQRRAGDGSLVEVGRWDSGGRGGSYVAFDPTGRYFVVANAHSCWAVFRDQAEPELIASVTHVGSGPHPRQAHSHPHCAVFSLDGAWIYAADMGADEVLALSFDAQSGQVGEPFVVYRAAPGSGPRHLLICDDTVFLLNELGNTLVVLGREPDGQLQVRQTASTLPVGFAGDSHTAHLGLSHDGRRLYVSNRGHDSIAVFDVHHDGSVTLRACVSSGGRWPWFFLLTNDERMLVANNLSDAITVFALDDAGIPQLTDTIAIRRPVYIVEAPQAVEATATR